MIEEKIYEHLDQFVGAFGPIFNILPLNSQLIKTFTSFMPLVFEANVIIMDLNQKCYFRVSLEDHYFVRNKNFNFCNLTLVSDSRTWIRVFSGQETLMGAYNSGSLEMNAVREQYILRLAFLSGIFFTFATKKQRLIRTGKYIRLPFFSRRILEPIFKILFNVLKLIPEHAIERLMKRISPLLEEFE